MDGRDTGGPGDLKVSELGVGFVAKRDWPTVKECEEFNRRANEWLRKRAIENDKFDKFEYGKYDPKADRD